MGGVSEAGERAAKGSMRGFRGAFDQAVPLQGCRPGPPHHGGCSPLVDARDVILDARNVPARARRSHSPIALPLIGVPAPEKLASGGDGCPRTSVELKRDKT